MKLKSALFASFFILFFFLGIPLMIMQVNNFFNLPVINSAILKIIAFVFLSIEAIFSIHIFWVFGKYGKGSPIITEPTKRFVAKGLYKFVRNPMYVGHVLVLLGIFFFFGHILLLLYAILGFTALNLVVIFWEEPGLRKKFGKEYEEYLKKVKRWGLF